MEPRHFWRRLIAVFIDFAILSQLAFYLMVPFANGDDLRLSGGLYQSVSCQSVTIETDALGFFEAQGIAANNASLCKSYQNGILAGNNLVVSGADNGAAVTLPINQLGEAVNPTFPLAILSPLLVLAGMIFMAWLWNGQTLGKRITSVQVVTMEGDFLSLGQIAIREVLKFAPVIILISIGIFLPEYSLERAVPLLQSGENIAIILGFLGISTFMYILWWVAPLIWWNGTMPYDRLNRSMVERYYS